MKISRSTAIAIALVWISSVCLMLANTQPELSYDEASYASSTTLSWHQLWSSRDYSRHGHGPLMIYLAKLGRDHLPAQWLSIETRMRLPIVLVSALAPVIAWIVIRHAFGGSKLAAWLGSSLLLLSVIRLAETNIFGPHGLMLDWMLAICGIGYAWRNRIDWKTVAVLGCVFALAGVTMTYAIPLVICWLASTAVGGGKWLTLDRRRITVSLGVLAVMAIAIVGMAVLWPPSILQRTFWNDFVYYADYFRQRGQPTLLGGVVHGRVGPSAYLYWFTTLDLPLLLTGVPALGWVLRQAVRAREEAYKYRYLAAFNLILILVAASAHIAGSRNALQFLGVTCIVVAVAADDIRAPSFRHVRIYIVAATVILAVVNLGYQWWAPRRIPYLATNGYAKFVEENSTVLAENEVAIVGGIPILRFYASQAAKPIAWQTKWTHWTSDQPAELPDNAKYALLTELVYKHYPREHPAQSVIVPNWQVVWEYKRPRTFGLRLYRRPNTK